MFEFSIRYFGDTYASATPTYLNANTTSALSAEMVTYYNKTLIKLAKPKLVYSQLGQKANVPQNGGDKINWRKYDPLPKITVALQEGITPDGQSLNVTAINATVKQYGAYVTLSDWLLLTAIDKNLQEATELCSDQGARSFDTLTRNALEELTNIQYAEGTHNSVAALTVNDDKMSVKAIRMAVRTLKNFNAPAYGDGSYVAVVHPDISFDLMSDTAWQKPHEYVDTKNIYAGEIGKLYGVRFLETTEAPVQGPDVISDGKNILTIKANVSNSTTVTVNEVLTAGTYSGAAAIPVYVDGTANTIVAIANNTTCSTLTLGTAITKNKDVKITGQGTTPGGLGVYSTYVLGQNCFGVTEIEGGGMQMIIKQLGSGGTADPLNQRATCGFKFSHAAKVLVDAYGVCIKTVSSNAATTDSN